MSGRWLQLDRSVDLGSVTQDEVEINAAGIEGDELVQAGTKISRVGKLRQVAAG